MELFAQLSADTQGLLIDLAGNITQIITILVGILIAAYQIRKGYTQSISLQKETIKNEYLASLHAEIEEVIEDLIEKNGVFSTSLRNISMSFHFVRNSFNAGIQNPIVRVDSIQELQNKKNDLSKAIIRLISIVEKYEIVEPRIKLFKTAFNVAFFDLEKIFQQLFTTHLLNVLPNQPEPDMLSLPFRMPNQEQEDRIIDLINKCLNQKHDVGSYTYDLRVEIQNLLLSGIFGRKLERRKPLDPTLKVISTDSLEYERLIKYFEEETAWGRNKQEVEAEVSMSYQSLEAGGVHSETRTNKYI